MFIKTMSVLMVATLTLFAAEADKAPAAKPVKEQKVSSAEVAAPVATSKTMLGKSVAPVSDKAPKAAMTSATGSVNINTATAAELQKLHGIGASKAQAIVDYRKAHGAFKNTDDIVNVPGIGDKIFAGIKGDVKVR